MEFGGNPLEMLMKNGKIKFSFTVVSTQYYSYYSIALYDHTWGLSSIEADEVDKCEVISCAGDNVVKHSIE